jgi:acyl dehydratase
MAPDPSRAGFCYPPTAPYLVGREKIREFADAIGADDPAYRDPEAAKALGHPDVIAPPTFPVVVAAGTLRQLLDDPALGLELSRLLHGEQRFTYTRPVRAGDRLVCVLTIERITSRAGSAFLTTRTEIATEEGEPVCTAWNKFVVKGA